MLILPSAALPVAWTIFFSTYIWPHLMFPLLVIIILLLELWLWSLYFLPSSSIPRTLLCPLPIARLFYHSLYPNPNHDLKQSRCNTFKLLPPDPSAPLHPSPYCFLSGSGALFWHKAREDYLLLFCWAPYPISYTPFFFTFNICLTRSSGPSTNRQSPLNTKASMILSEHPIPLLLSDCTCFLFCLTKLLGHSPCPCGSYFYIPFNPLPSHCHLSPHFSWQVDCRECMIKAID